MVPDDFLTNSEKNTIKKYQELRLDVKKINKRINNCCKKYHEDKKKQQEEKTRLQKEIRNKLKIKNFTKEYKKLKNRIYKTKDLKKLEKTRKDFINKCIHPTRFIGIGYYIEYYDSGGGQGSDTSSMCGCKMCKLCGSLLTCDTKHDFIDEDFYDFDLNDTPENIDKISINLN